MVQKSALEELFEKLKLLLLQAQEHKGQFKVGDPDPAVYAQLEILEKNIELMSQATELTIKKLGILEDNIQSTLQNRDNLPEEGRKLLEQADELERLLNILRRDSSIAVTIAKQKENIRGTGSQAAARQKKFRRVGGKKDWKPL